MPVKKLWEIRWEQNGSEVDEHRFLWVIARNSAEASQKAQRFLRKIGGRCQVTGTKHSGNIDVF